MLIFLVLLVAIALVAVIWAVAAYNGFVKSRNHIQEAWRQIDVELNRRYDLIPNLIETVRGFAAHERNTLEQITSLRSTAQSLAGQSGGQPNEQRAAVESELTQAVHNLLVSVESYPELKSNTNFLELQRELSDTEDRIAAARRFYNANVRDYNTRIESVPTNLVAGFAKFEKATYFEVNDPMVRQAPQVNFGEISQRPASQHAVEAHPPSQSPLPAPASAEELSAPPAEQLPVSGGYQPPFAKGDS